MGSTATLIDGPCRGLELVLMYGLPPSLTVPPIETDYSRPVYRVHIYERIERTSDYRFAHTLVGHPLTMEGKTT